MSGQFTWRTSNLPQGRRLAILSSRLGRDARIQQLWLNELKQVVDWTKQTNRVLVVVDETTAARPVARLAKRRHVPMIRYRLSSASPTRSTWFEQALSASVEMEHAEPPTVFVAPLLNPGDDTEANRLPDRDELLASLGDDLVALKIRAGSTTERLLTTRLSKKDQPSKHVGACWLSRVPGLIAADVSVRLTDRGAQQFSGANLISAPSECCVATSNRSGDSDYQQLINHAADESVPFLTHWTRAKESVSLQKLSDAELDELLLSDENCDRSALGVLLSILKQRRIRATAQTIRGPVPVVCFTAMPLQQITEQRTFRTHRGRWDFEHYGLCIRREALRRFGARPVIYGTDEEFESLSDADRPWFQLRASASSSSEIDWTIEQEWRMPGDVDLTLFSPDDVVVFVRSRSEISAVKAITNWPVIAIESLMRSSDR